jgi:hypothetical protein
MDQGGDILEWPAVLPSASDLEFADRLVEGVRDAFKEVYGGHSAAVFRFSYHMTGDRTKAAELTLR